MPRVIQVIQTEEQRGDGTQESPLRQVSQYYTLEGEFLAEDDPLRDYEPPQPPTAQAGERGDG